MGWLQRQFAAVRFARKAYSTAVSFSTNTTADEWYARNGYRGISAALNGYGRDRALQLAALYGGIKIIGEDMGSLPLRVMRKTGVGWERAEDHPLYQVLHDQPNPETTAIEFRESMTAQAALCLRSYARIIRNSEGAVIALWQLAPEDIKREQNSYGVPSYKIKNRNGSEDSISSEEMFVLRGFSVDHQGDRDILQIAQRTIGLAIDQNEYASRYFSDNQKPPFYVKFPAGMMGGRESVETFLDAWEEFHRGNHNRPAIVGDGGELVELRPDNERAQLVEQRRFQIGEICRLIRLSPHKLADLERATFSNIEHLNIQHYTETLRPYAVRWEQAIRARLLREEERSQFKAEHAIEGFLRGDFKTQTEGFSRLLEKGVYSINNVREFLGLNPIEGGDEHYVQLNMQAVGDATAEESVPIQGQDGRTVSIPIRRLKELFPKAA